MTAKKNNDSIEKVKTPVQAFMYILLHPKTWLIVIILTILIILGITVKVKYADGKWEIQKQEIPLKSINTNR